PCHSFPTRRSSDLSVTDQSPVFEALMTCWTCLPRRGPAARALTTRFCDRENPAASASAMTKTSTSRTLSSSAMLPGKSAPSSVRVANVRRARGRRKRRSLDFRTEEAVEEVSMVRAMAAARPASAEQRPEAEIVGLAHRGGRRAAVAGQVHGRDEAGIGGERLGVGIVGQVHGALTGQSPVELLDGDRQQRSRDPAEGLEAGEEHIEGLVG